MTVDRLPPHSTEAEQATLGCCLLDTSKITDCVVRFGRVGADVFYDLRHQTIFRAMVQMHDGGEAVDIITLQQHLRDAQLLDQCGGLIYLSGLPEAAVSASNVTQYADILMEKCILRQMIYAATEVVGKIYDHEGDVAELLDETERKILAVRSIDLTVKTKSVKQSVNNAIQYIEDCIERKGTNVMGTPTGFVDLDALTMGLRPSKMFVLAARPSTGKTSLAMNIVEHFVIDLDQPAGVFSLETDIDSLVLRMIASRARVNMRNIADGFLAERDFPKIVGAAGNIAKSNLHVDDASGLSIMDLRARARRMHSEFGIKLLVIDYLQLLTASINGRRVDKRQQEVAEISVGVKGLAKELGIPIIGICQLSRDIEKTNRRPRMSDLRESGQLEQDADLIGLMYRPKGDDDDAAPSEDAVPINVEIAKNKDGPTGTVHLTFLRAFTRFESASKISDEEIDQQHFPYKS